MYEKLFGTPVELGWEYMSIRALMIFFMALILFRVAGKRSLGQKNAFDLCVTVLLGAVLSRAIVGASAFFPTLAAGAVLVLLHRAIATVAVISPRFDRLINGSERILVKNGEIDSKQMQEGLITIRDLDEAIRKRTGGTNVQSINKVVLERNGELTVIPFESHKG